MSAEFFDKRRDNSEVKARIVSTYFSAWANVIMPSVAKRGGKIRYIDLYAGPGRYKSGEASTPLLIVQKAIADPQMASMLVAQFNDAEEEHAVALEAEITRLTGVEKLAHRPRVTCREVDDEIAQRLGQARLEPTFSFIDPFGFSGLTMKMIRAVIKDWGCDCVFFFNYTRINAGLSNSFMNLHMNALFGSERADTLRTRLLGLTPELRQAAILEELANAIRGAGGEFVLPFTFKSASGARTSHMLIFVTKHFLGYSIMKDIMARESSTEDEGVRSFCYSPADESTPWLFSLRQPLGTLKQSLLEEFAGLEIGLEDIYKSHSVDSPYVKKNYRQILKQLESDGAISARSTTGRRVAGTFPSHVLVSFPARTHNGH